MMRFRFLTGCLLGLLLLAACESTPSELPTRVAPERLPTEAALTQNAPPPGFDEVSFPRIDANTRSLPGWQYEMTFQFVGVAGTRETATRTDATVWYEQLGTRRRVVATVDNDLQGEGDPINYEAVRLGPDTFLVRDDTCLSNAGEDSSIAADLSAGVLLGGVQRATTAADKAVINSEDVWRYDFTLDDLVLPNVRFGEDSRVLQLTGELWVSPEYDAVVRYYVNMDVENVRLFDSDLPVSGTLILRYDLYDIGTMPNISVPFGC